MNAKSKIGRIRRSGWIWAGLALVALWYLVYLE
jgi:hypothetical protein